MAEDSLFSAFTRRPVLQDYDPKLTSVLYPTLYKSLKLDKIVCRPSEADCPYGSVFNIEFSPSDSVALTACSNNAILGYDPRINSLKSIYLIPHAHEDCTNCITFIDATIFVSCSDDKTIRLWDLRNLKSPIYILKGHTNWVKNIEFNQKSQKIFSTAFNDGIREWDMNKLNSYSCEESDNLVLKLKDPVRMRIAPDGSKMFVSLRRNKCLVIDEFDGSDILQRHDVVKTLQEHQTSKPSDFQALKSNKPSLHVISGLSGNNSYRAVMSVAFHPSSKFVALRHIDVKRKYLEGELTTLYDLRTPSENPISTIESTSKNFLKYIDERSSDDTIDFIKEFCFSPDGRILASPCGHSVRLLAADPSCASMELRCDDRILSPGHCLDFEVVGTVYGHTNPTLSCRFAHHDVLLGTGCFKGQVLFHKPQL